MRKVVLGEARDTTSTGGGRSQGVVKFLGFLSAEMAKRVEGIHTEFLWMIMGKRARILGDGTWETPGAEGVQDAVVTQSDRIYIEQRNSTVAQ